MIDLNNVFYLVLGGVIGYRVAKLELQVEEIKRKEDAILKRDQRGFVDLKAVIIAFLLLITSASAIATGIANVHSNQAADRSNRAVDRMETIGYCSQDTLVRLLKSVNERSTTTKPALKSNIAFQQSFSDLLDQLLHVPPFSPEENFKVAQEIHTNQEKLIEKQKQQLGDVKANPLPTIEQYKTCLKEDKHQKEVNK